LAACAPNLRNFVPPDHDVMKLRSGWISPFGPANTNHARLIYRTRVLGQQGANHPCVIDGATPSPNPPQPPFKRHFSPAPVALPLPQQPKEETDEAERERAAHRQAAVATILQIFQNRSLGRGFGGDNKGGRCVIGRLPLARALRG